MPELKELQTSYQKAYAVASALMAETKGRDTTPEEEVKLDAAFADADGLKVKIDQQIKYQDREKSIAGHMDFQSKGTGHVDLATGTAADTFSTDSGDGSVMQGKWLGVQREGKFVPVFHEDQLKRQPHLQQTIKSEYRQAFASFLKNSFAEMTPQDQQILLQGKALSEGSNTGGGFAVPLDFLSEVIMRIPGVSVFQDRARAITTSRDRVEAPRIKANATTPNMYSSAVTMTMVSETPSAATGLIDPVFEAVPIGVNTAKLETLVSRNLLSDAAFDVAGYLSEEFRRAAVLGKDQKFLTGTGLSEPLGVTKDPDISTITSATVNVLGADDLKELIYSLAVQYQPGAILGLSLNCLKTIRKIKDGDGNFIWSPGLNHGLVEGVPPTIEGFPYVVSDFLPTVATGNIPMFFGNPRFYWIINRLDMAMEILREVYAEQNQLAYLAFLRFGGHVVVPEAFRTLTIA